VKELTLNVLALMSLVYSTTVRGLSQMCQNEDHMIDRPLWGVDFRCVSESHEFLIRSSCACDRSVEVVSHM